MKTNFTFLFMAFLVIVIGATLITSIASNVQQTTTPFTLTNESLDITSARNCSLDCVSINESYNLSSVNDNWVASSVTLRMLNGTSFASGTDYVVSYGDDTIQLRNTTTTYNYGSNDTGIYYQFYGDSYVNDSGARGVIPLILILFAIGIVIAVIVYFKQGNEGIV